MTDGRRRARLDDVDDRDHEAGRRLRRGRRRRGRRRARRRSATSTSRLRHPAAAATPTTSTWSSSAGRIQRVPIDGGEPSRLPRHRRPGHLRRRAGAALGRLRPRLRRLRALLRQLHRHRRATRGSVEYRRSADDPATADPDSARELLHDRRLRRQPQRRPAAVRPRRRPLPRHRRRRRRRRPGAHGAGPGQPLGKLLRIDPARARASYEARGARAPQPVALLLRPRTGDLWIGDVGQDTLEEIDAVPRRAELGAGSQLRLVGVRGRPALQRRPAGAGRDRRRCFEYGRDRGCSVTGGYVVRDPELPSLDGRYLYGDFCEGELRSFPADPDRPATDDRALGLRVRQLSSFGEDARRARLRGLARGPGLPAESPSRRRALA